MVTQNRYHISPQQKQLFHCEKSGAEMVAQALIRFKGQMDKNRALELFRYLLNKNAALRTRLVSEKGFVYPLQEVQSVDDILSNLNVIEGDLTVARKLQQDSYALVDRSNPIAFAIVHSNQEFWIDLTVSSYNADSFSFQIISEQVQHFLLGEVRDNLEEEVTYLEFANWQEELPEDLTTDEKTFWERYPVGPYSAFGFQRNDVMGSFEKESRTYVVSNDLTSKLEASYPGQLEEVLLTLWLSVLSKHNKGETLTLGVIPNGRAFPEISSLVGLVNSTLPITIDFSHDRSLIENIKSVKNKIEELNTHQYHFILSDDQVASRGMEASVGFQFLAICADKSCMCQMECLGSFHDQHKINLSAYDHGETLLLQFQYEKDVYSEKTVNMLHEQVIVALNGLLSQPHEPFNTISLSQVENEAIRHIGRSAERMLAYTDVPELFDKRAHDHPAKIAVTFNGKEISYNALQLSADGVAKTLISKYGISINDRVGVFMERSDILVSILLGIMKSGATYVPIDPNDTEFRARYIIEDSGCRVIIQDGATSEVTHTSVEVVEASSLLDFISEVVDFPTIQGSDPAYMIYTSGTSGKLKGVPIKHESLLNYVHWIQETLDISEKDSTPLVSSHAFDLGYTSLWGSLLSGGSLDIVPEYLIHTPEILVEHLNGNGVTYIKTTPSMFNLLLHEAGESLKFLLKGLRMLVLGGEKLNIKDIEHVWEINPELRIVNHYGPTEGTIGIMAHDLEKNRIEYYRNHSIIGEPAYNNSVFVLDSQYEPCPPGVSGEIYLSGMSIANGYHDKLEISSERFITHPTWNKTLYRTGDEGRWNAYAELEFMGRLDGQVKINGYRVELSEIETATHSISAVQDSVVSYLDSDEGKVLACYYVSDEFIEQVFFRRELSDILPKYMIPAVYRKIPSIPLTINGKVDLTSLPDISKGMDSAVHQMEPTNKLEGVVLSVWRDVLSNERIGIYDNFFERGGDSIKAIQIASRLHNAGYGIQVSDIFNNPTVASVTEMVKESVIDLKESIIEGPISMTPVFHYFFENIKQNPNHYNQSFWLDVGNHDLEALNPVFEKIMEYHDIFRLNFKRDAEDNLTPEIAPKGYKMALSTSEFNDEGIEEIERFADEQHTKFDLKKGPLIRGHLLRKGDKNFLLIVMHHLVSDVVSWGVLIDDLRNLLGQQAEGRSLQLPPKTSSYGDWAKSLNEYAKKEVIQQQLSYWSGIPLEVSSPVENPNGSNLIKDVRSVACSMLEEDTEKLRPQNNAEAPVHVAGHVIAAIGMAFRRIFGTNELLLMLESHGREDINENINLYRTIGWFTALYPLHFKSDSEDLKSNLDQINEEFSKVPQNGIGYGLLRYLSGAEGKKLQHRPNIRFNYLGDHIENSSNQNLQIADYPSGCTEDRNGIRPFEIDIIAHISSGQLHVSLSYSKHQFSEPKMNALMDVFKALLVETLEVEKPEIEQKILSEDLTYNALSQEDLESFF